MWETDRAWVSGPDGAKYTSNSIVERLFERTDDPDNPRIKNFSVYLAELKLKVNLRLGYTLPKDQTQLITAAYVQALLEVQSELEQSNQHRQVHLRQQPLPAAELFPPQLCERLKKKRLPAA